MTSILDDLQQRGLIAQATDLDTLHSLLTEPQVIYCGFDPTAGSLHIGHLVPLILMQRFRQAGHKPLALIGGATGMIGDPSFKATERMLNSAETVQGWVAQLAQQIRGILPAEDAVAFEVVNNADWIGSLNVIEFLRDIGKHFSINAMMNRESVRQRLERAEQGISFTEFSYALLQSYDFAYLNRKHGCTLQIGGSDQWGNIVSGIDLTRRLNGNKVFGMTLPLITKADGTKFGKTEGGAVWLDARQTSPFSFYQFWLNTNDDDVYRFLRYYTFLSLEDIEALEVEDKQRVGKPRAQQVLAEQVTRFVHGEDGLSSAQRITQAMFDGQWQTLTQAELAQIAQDGLPVTAIEASISLSQALVTSGLAKSRRIARELISDGAIRVNGERVQHDNLSGYFALFDRYWVIQRGKKSFHLLCLQ